MLGGSFDPVHWGHLRSALELIERLGFDSLSLMPCHTHAHEKTAGASAEHRLAMLVHAVAMYSEQLQVDDRELRRAGVSYSVDSLAEIRAERGEDAIIGFVMGSDAWRSFHRWHDWPRILQLVNIVIMERAEPVDRGDRPALAEPLEAIERDCGVVRLSAPAGGILRLALAPQPYSSTQARALLQGSASVEDSGATLQDILPAPVLSYVLEHALYRG